MRALLSAAVAAFCLLSIPVFAQDECYQPDHVIADLQQQGAQLVIVLDKREEIDALLAQLPPPPPEFHLDQASVVQIWVRRDVARVIFFDAKGCAETKFDADAAMVLSLVPGA